MTANALPTPGHDDPALAEALAAPPLLRSVAQINAQEHPPTDHDGDGDGLLDFIVTETMHSVELTQQRPGLPFTMKFVSSETGWYADGYEAQETTHHESERVLQVPLPEVFDVVNSWLLTEHQMAVLPHSWQINTLDTDNQLSLHGRAATARRLTHTAG